MKKDTKKEYITKIYIQWDCVMNIVYIMAKYEFNKNSIGFIFSYRWV